MPVDNYIELTPDYSSCLNLNQQSEELCLPKVEICNQMILGGWFIECGDSYVCRTKCWNTKSEYFHPVIAGQTFMLQTTFFDGLSTDRTQPDNNFVQVSLVFQDGTEGILANAVPPGAQTYWYTYGFTGEYSYQTFRFDVDNLKTILGADNCFQLKFDDQQGNVYYTQWFRVDAGCRDLIGIESEFQGSDCYNNFYNDPIDALSNDGDGFSYSNRILIPANVKYFGESNEITRFNDRLISKVKSKALFKTLFNEGLPPFLVRLLGRVYFSGSGEILVDGDTYLYDQVSITQPSKVTELFLPAEGIEIYTRCSSSSNCG